MKYTIPQNLSYKNFQEELKKAEKLLKTEQILEFEENIKITTPTKAFIRYFLEKYPKKIKISTRFQEKISYKTEDFVEKKEKKAEFLLSLGNKLIKNYNSFVFFLIIIVDMLYYSFTSFWDKKFIVKNDLLKNSYQIGNKGIPIVFMLSFLIGLTITLQSAVQLSKLGGQGYIATLIGTAMFKELGPLLTAIIIAGRTGSSIAAEIGTMVVMEEVDALQTMGVKPLKFLLVPKFWAFTLSMPILVLISDFSGVFGGLLIAKVYGVPVHAFISQTIGIMQLSDFFWGTMKSLAFAWAILGIACFKGLNVRGGSDAVGKATTESVVIAIFSVVVIDAIFSVILYM